MEALRHFPVDSVWINLVGHDTRHQVLIPSALDQASIEPLQFTYIFKQIKHLPWEIIDLLRRVLEQHVLLTARRNRDLKVVLERKKVEVILESPELESLVESLLRRRNRQTECRNCKK